MRFLVFQNGQPGSIPDVESAYMIGQDAVPVRAQIADRPGEVQIKLRAEGAAALCLLYDVPGFGCVMLETTRLPERPEPYVLSVELLRRQLFVAHQKFEDWGLMDFSEANPLARQLDELRAKLVEALCLADDPPGASKLAEESLARVIQLNEQVAVFHASLFLSRRIQASGPRKRESVFGCTLDPLSIGADYRRLVAGNFDFVQLPISWKQIEPKEKELNWERLDGWVEWAIQNRLPVWAGPLVAFDERNLPDWLILWEHDFEAIRDLIYEHIGRVVARYRGYVSGWTVVSSIAASNSFNFTFDQIIEMTRLAATRTRQTDNRVRTMVEIAFPWGEYHARNMRTIPPLLYADMAAQSGASFDALALQFYFGLGADGYYVRDLMSISMMLDRFAGFAKPVHISGVGVPSAATPDPWDAWGGAKAVAAGGQWRRDWDESLQARWLELFYMMCLSKPFVRSIAWRDLADYEGHFISHGGLNHADLSPKSAWEAYRRFRTSYQARGKARLIGLEPLDLDLPESLKLFEPPSP